MPTTAYIESILSGLDPNSRRIIGKALETIVSQMKFGPPVRQQPTRNWGGLYVQGATADVPGEEFIVEHNLGKIPYLAIPVLSPRTTGSAVLDLAVTRPADDRYLYLKSSVPSTAFWLIVEG
jgi:hypothetical protein